MIFILGAQGYVGGRFTTFLNGRGIKAIPLSRAEVDYGNTTALRKLLRQNRPKFLINAAGFTGKPNVDACESAKADTLAGNTVLPLRIAEACTAENVPWGHISSGCIYQGARGTDAAGLPLGFREEDEPNFSFSSGRCSFYSGTKALAEQLLKGAPNTYIWRLRVPFDHRDSPRNYLSKLLNYQRLLDVRNSLSHLDDFVASCWATMERGLPFGTYNVTNPGSVTTREVVDLIRQEGEARRKQGDTASAERMLKDFNFFESEEEFMRLTAIAPRSSCVLDTTKAEHYGLPLRPVREALVDSLRNWSWEKAS
jgi:dTDP-4-dehydrorhamnose reductase